MNGKKTNGILMVCWVLHKYINNKTLRAKIHYWSHSDITFYFYINFTANFRNTKTAYSSNVLLPLMRFGKKPTNYIT